MRRKKNLCHAEFGEIRVVEDDKGDIWYLAKDIMTALDVGNYYVTSKVNYSSKRYVNRDVLVDVTSGKPLVALNKEGVSTMVFFSQKPNKFDFKKWIMGEDVDKKPINNKGDRVTSGINKNEENTPTQFEVFKHGEFGEVRTVVRDEDNNPWFVAKDVAEALGYTNPQKAIRDHCKGVNETFLPSKGGVQTVKIIPEPDLYRLIIKSKLPSAEKFERWVFEEVLPSIRKCGGYLVTRDEDTPEDILARAVLVAHDTISRKNKQIKKLEDEAITINQRITILSHVNKTYSTTELAKELGLTSARALNNELHKRKIQYKQNGTWVLYSKYSNLGYTEIKQSVLDTGRVVYNRRFTQCGREWLINLLS